MKLSRLLAHGISGWLQFEFACQRAPVFSEKYLTVPIAQILNTKFGDKVHAEIKHPILGLKTLGRGRPPEIDFVVYGNNQEIKVAIESKWVGKNVSKKTVERVFWDLTRLAMIGNNQDVTCCFILAGRRKDLENLFSNKYFRGEKDAKGRYRPILKTRPSDFMDVRLDSPKADRLQFLKPIFKLCQDIDLPMRLGTGHLYYGPKDANKYEYQVYVWEVLPHKQKIVFKPKNHKHYKV